MRHLASLVFFAASLLAPPPAAANPPAAPTPPPLSLPELGLSYEIEVELEPATRQLRGRETIRWTNDSGAPVETLRLHLYLNGFSSEASSWMQGRVLSRFDPKEMYALYDDFWGYSDLGEVRAGGEPLSWRYVRPDDGNPNDHSLVEFALPAPLPPGETVALELDFEARLPIPIARTGGYEDFFLVAQWFPKLSARQGPAGAQRWGGHQFHGVTEFFADYAAYDVRIGVPEGFQVAATGLGGPEAHPTGAPGLSWHRFQQRGVHDFAWVTGSELALVDRQHTPTGADRPVLVRVVLPQHAEAQAGRWAEVVEASLDVMGARVGPYPYESLTLVMSPFRASKTLGMEYPTLITGVFPGEVWEHPLSRDLRIVEGTIAHEFAHQYFYGLVGSNEFEEAFLDEGLTNHWGNEIMEARYGPEATDGALLGWPMPRADQSRRAQYDADRLTPAVRSSPSYALRGFSVGRQFYSRPDAIFQTLERRFGRAAHDAFFQAYFARWAFGHPRYEDLITAAEASVGPEAAAFLDEAFRQRTSPDYRVSELTSTRWTPPRGRLRTPDGVETVPRAGAPEGSTLGLDPAALEASGELSFQVITPGHTRLSRWVEGALEPGDFAPGTLSRRSVPIPPAAPPGDEPAPADPGAADEGPRFYVSTARIEGSDWDHLPTTVRFTFEDGVSFDDPWDGRGVYREYRFLRASRLIEVRVDPEGQNLLDPAPENDGLRLEPDQALTHDWAGWLATLAQLLSEGLLQWL